IGIYVLLRRWTAPGSTHFYIFCLVSFVFYAFKYTGKLNDVDWTIYWVNVTAWLLQPALFLHFVLTFPEKRQFVSKHQWLIPLVFGYAIFRYRLMDVDLIFKRGMVYTLAAAAIVGAYFAVVAAVAELVHARVPSSGPAGMILAIAVTALLFDPVRKWIQERID